jgi:hypothetical protein
MRGSYRPTKCFSSGSSDFSLVDDFLMAEQRVVSVDVPKLCDIAALVANLAISK